MNRLRLGWVRQWGGMALGLLLMANVGIGGAEEPRKPPPVAAESFKALFPRLVLPETVRAEEAIRPGEWADVRIPVRNEGEGTLILRRVNTG